MDMLNFKISRRTFLQASAETTAAAEETTTTEAEETTTTEPEGDVVTVMNLQSKRTFSGTVSGRNQVLVSAPQPVATASLPAPVAVAANTALSDPRKAESR